MTSADEVTWAIDLADGPAALLIALLLHREQQLVYLPGIAVNRATAGYRGEGKTDAKDAAIIADQARMRRDLRPLRLGEPMVLELRMLTTHRADLAADRTRAINRLRGRLVGICPALEARPGLHLPRPAHADRRVPDRRRHPGGRPRRAASAGCAPTKSATPPHSPPAPTPQPGNRCGSPGEEPPPR